MTTHTKEETKAKAVASAMLKQETNPKAVTVEGIKITVVDGFLKTDWQMEEVRQHKLSVETSRQQKIANRTYYLLGGHAESIVDEMQIEDVYVKNEGGELKVFDPWE